MGIKLKFNDNETKHEECHLLHLLAKWAKVGSGWNGFYSECEILSFREKRCAFSLDFRPIGPSILDGARSKVALRGEGYAWALIWWNSDNSKW